MLTKFSPMQQGIFGTGVLGFLAIVSVLQANSSIPTIVLAYSLLLGALMLTTSLLLWKKVKWGWYLGVIAMLAAGLFGFIMTAEMKTASSSLPIDYNGFFLVAGGLFFSWLARPESYPSSNDEKSYPPLILASAPLLLIVAGSAFLASSNELGLIVSGVLILVVLVSGRWLYKPLICAIRQDDFWNVE